MDDKITNRVIEDEMKESYLAYSMSVIVGRALPDVRDGLKPVHRRILYAMKDVGMVHNKPFKKSARIVGEVLGKYHPHGDTAVYDSMVRMAQEFSLRYPLINGQGNFGSIDGDSAASMRYTEARLNKLSEELLEDIEKETVDFVPNFDGSLKEPTCLPSKVPNLLINGSSGIAVGMATNIPPHNLSEVCEGVIQTIDNPDVDILDLMEYVKGPDFPTGGIIQGRSGIKHAYTSGKGKVVVKAKITTEKVKGKTRLLVHEIPYMVNKSQLLEQIAFLVRDKRIEGISDLRDESDREGMRIVIELKQNANPEVVQNQLFKYTRLMDSFGIIMLSLVDGQPRVLNLKQMFDEFIKHRKEVVTRRTEYELRVAKEKEHILLGLITALDHIDEIVDKIKKSANVEAASQMLRTDYTLSEKQAKAILEMRLQKLSSLEQQKLRTDLENTKKVIAELESILADVIKLMNIIKDELREIKEKYGDQRKSEIVETEEFDVDDEDLIKEEKVVVTLSHSGYVKRVPLDTYRAQNRGGRGVIAAKTKDEDFVEKIFVASTHAYLLVFTDKGKIYWQKVYRVPQGSRTSRGIPIVNLIDTQKGEKVQAVIPVREFEEDKFLLFATKNGTVKRTALKHYSNPRKGGIIAISLDEQDCLVNVVLTNGNDLIMLATKDGRAVKFKEGDAREMGRSARGVRGIKTIKSEVVGMIVAKDNQAVFTATNKGFGKRTEVSDYRLINRGGSGVINIKCTEKNGEVVAIRPVTGEEDLLLISRKGVVIRIPSNSVSIIGRNTQGVRVMRLQEGDELVAVAKAQREVKEEFENNETIEELEE